MPADRNTAPQERNDKAEQREIAEREPDQDSEAPRTAVPPGVSDEERDWGRQEGC